jgi:hypothetical protein
MTSYLWPDEKKARVALLLKEGKTSREIGADLGVTRNSVIGIVRRNSDLSAIGFASRPGGQVPKPKDEQQAYDREYLRAWRAKRKGVVIPFPAQKRPQQRHDPRPALRVVSNNVPLMVQDWLDKNGGARRFERNATADKLAVKLYLEARGIKTNGFRGKWTISTGKGRPKQIKWPEVVQIADDFRMAEGLEPFLPQSAPAQNTMTRNGGRG